MQFSNWKWPTVPGLHDFKGKLMHSATWDQNYNFTGKRIAVIGAGSSGVQIVATLYNKVEKLYTWVRSPTWITAGFAQDFAAEDGKNFYCKFHQDYYHQSTSANNSKTVKSRKSYSRTIQSNT